MDLRKHALDESAHWRDLANTIEQSMCGGDMAFLLNYFAHRFAAFDMHQLLPEISSDSLHWLQITSSPLNSSHLAPVVSSFLLFDHSSSRSLLFHSWLKITCFTHPSCLRLNSSQGISSGFDHIFCHQVFAFLWLPCVADAGIVFLLCGFYLSSSRFFLA